MRGGRHLQNRAERSCLLPLKHIAHHALGADLQTGIRNIVRNGNRLNYAVTVIGDIKRKMDLLARLIILLICRQRHLNPVFDNGICQCARKQADKHQ